MDLNNDIKTYFEDVVKLVPEKRQEVIEVFEEIKNCTNGVITSSGEALQDAAVARDLNKLDEHIQLVKDSIEIEGTLEEIIEGLNS